MGNPSAAIWFCPHCLATGAESVVTYCPNDGTPVCPVAERGAAWIGRTLAGRYRIERFLGAGGCAEVYAATQRGSERQVAVKLLNAAFASMPGAAERFRNEAQLISLVAHPNIVAISDFGTLEDRTPYMVMELLEGESLAARLEVETLPPALAFRLVQQICEGLAAAHERGVIHRDVKPENLFLPREPGPGQAEVKILDLGIARLFGAAPGSARLTRQGTVFGTPEYMSPEQATAGEVGPAADVYSLACVLWEMLFGAPPFTDPSVIGVLAKQVQATPQWPQELAQSRGVPTETRSLLLRALAKDPASRPASMLDFQAELSSLIGRSRAAVRRTEPAPVPATPRPPPPSIRRVRISTDAVGDDAVVEVAPDVYWVGRRHGVQLECNAYLCLFRGDERTASVLIDPGGVIDLEVVTRKVVSLIGSLDELDYIFLNHQDPDVASAAPGLQRSSRRAQVLTSEDTWRLVRFYGLDPARVTTVESLTGGVLGVSGGHELSLVPTPFCHFRGAVMLYHPAVQVLFSGDLCGGADAQPGLLATEAAWNGIAMFHQVYMPDNRAVRAAIGRIRALDPAPRLIATQHGGLLTGEVMGLVLDRLERLDVGIDLLERAGAGSASGVRHAAAANEILDALALVAGEERTSELVHRHAADGSFASPYSVRPPREIVGFRVEAGAALAALARDVVDRAPTESKSVIQRVIQRALERNGVASAHPPPRGDRPAGYRQVFESDRSTPPAPPPPRRR